MSNCASDVLSPTKTNKSKGQDKLVNNKCSPTEASAPEKKSSDDLKTKSYDNPLHIDGSATQNDMLTANQIIVEPDNLNIGNAQENSLQGASRENNKLYGINDHGPRIQDSAIQNDTLTENQIIVPSDDLNIGSAQENSIQEVSRENYKASDVNESAQLKDSEVC